MSWIKYQAYEVISGGRASAYYFFALRNEMAIGFHNWESDDFLYAYMKYYPGMSLEQLRQLRTHSTLYLCSTARLPRMTRL